MIGREGIACTQRGGCPRAPDAPRACIAPTVDIVERLVAEIDFGIDSQRVGNIVLHARERDDLLDVVIDEIEAVIEIGRFGALRGRGAGSAAGAGLPDFLVGGIDVGRVVAELSEYLIAAERIDPADRVPAAAIGVRQTVLVLQAEACVGIDVDDAVIGIVDVSAQHNLLGMVFQRRDKARIVIARAKQCRDRGVRRTGFFIQHSIVE